MFFSGQSFTLLDLLAVLLAGYIVGRVHAAARDPRRAEERRRQKLEDMRSAEDRLRRMPADRRRRMDALLDEGRIIEAVCDVREALGCGLKDAKDVVDLVRTK